MIRTSSILSFIYLLLFAENKDDIKEHVVKFVNFIKNIIEALEGEIKFESKCDDSFIEKWKDLLYSKKFKTNADQNLLLSWKTVNYWKANNHEVSSGLIFSPEGEYFHECLPGLIHRIIYFSNCKKDPKQTFTSSEVVLLK
jgi:hypothetical protein